MRGPASVRVVTRYTRDSGPAGADVTGHDQDLVSAEAPVSLEVRHAGGASRPLGLLMRTPGHDDDLARGVLVAEGVVTRESDILSVETFRRRTADREADGELALAEGLTVTVAPHVSLETLSEQVGQATSACGLCGRLALHRLDDRVPSARETRIRLSAGLIHALPERLREGQVAFGQTGGLHGAGAFSPDGTVIVVREDVGRHNAVDKVAGALLQGGHLPARQCVLAVSGRVAYEIVQKAVMCGIPMIVAVGAPTDLAVDAARATGITLVGFVRDDRFNVYTHGERVAAGENSAPA